MNAISGGGSLPFHNMPYQASLVDIFFPGFSFISTSAQQLLAGDLNSFTRLLCACGILVLFIRYAFNYISGVVRNYFTSTIHVSYYNEAYDMLVDWITRQQFVDNAHSLVARVGSSHNTITRSHAKKTLTFSPWDGSFPFWYKGHLLTLHCAVKEHREDIYISSIGRSPRILKELIEECRNEYLHVTQRKVSVFEHQDGEWKKARLKSVRPISTVIMDEQMKTDLVKDMEEFLDESTQRWYAARGFPYRRGYLLYGPPGTGKSSFSFSIAGRFDLDIYTLNLSGVGDGTLMKLFADLPSHCVILLEDVDAAGMGRRDDSNAGQTKPGSGVTLSGLLNVLDGVSSQEGRVLFMTTNHIEHLDEALIRPGRIDKKVYFELAGKDMTAQLFRTVFAQMPDAHKHSKEETNGEIIESLANDFAARVPEKIFSPAEVLSYLLERKSSPVSSVSGVEDWVGKEREAASQLKKENSWVQDG